MPAAGSPAGLLAFLTVAATAGAILAAPVALQDDVSAAMDLALADVNADWVDLADVRGIAHDHEVVDLLLLVRPDSIRGPLPVEPLDAADGRGRALSIEGVDAVRDEDDSLDEGRLTRGDLARLRLVLAEPVPEDARAQVELRHPHGPPLNWAYATPDGLDDGVNELYSDR